MAVDGFVDWLQCLDSAGGAFTWITKARKFPGTKCILSSKLEDVDQLVEYILRSRRIREVLGAECRRRRTALWIIENEARAVLFEMAHQMHMPVIRCVGYFLAKLIKTIYDGVYFNQSALLRIRDYVGETPVIFIPSHKSYMDFLLISVLCFDSNVPLPAVASGMDFMNSNFMGETLRRCGSFFMRRRFGKDPTYWSLFTEYVQTLLADKSCLLEFFLEGTRSRAYKSLYPKYGFLQICVEPYLRGRLFDLVIVPISVSYEKILEETLYAYEVFGYPKPKESTAGLLKARDILTKCYGHVYVNFGDPLSVRDFFKERTPLQHSLWEPDSQYSMSETNKAIIRELGHYIINEHNKNLIVTIWPYACSVLLWVHYTQSRNLTVEELTAELADFVSLVSKLKRRVFIRTNVSDDLRYFLRLHSNLFQGLSINVSDSDVLKFGLENEAEQCVDDHIKASLPEVILSNYTNQMMHDLVNLSFAAMVLLSTEHVVDSNSARQMFFELRTLFDHEFVCASSSPSLEALFVVTIKCLEASQFIRFEEGFISILDEASMRKIAQPFQPFIVKYYAVSLALFEFVGVHFQLRTLFDECTARQRGSRYRTKLKAMNSPFVTLDIVKNMIASLLFKGVVRKMDDEYSVDALSLQIVVNFLEMISLDKLSSIFDRAKL